MSANASKHEVPRSLSPPPPPDPVTVTTLQAGKPGTISASSNDRTLFGAAVDERTARGCREAQASGSASSRPADRREG